MCYTALHRATLRYTALHRPTLHLCGVVIGGVPGSKVNDGRFDAIHNQPAVRTIEVTGLGNLVKRDAPHRHAVCGPQTQFYSSLVNHVTLGGLHLRATQDGGRAACPHEETCYGAPAICHI